MEVKIDVPDGKSGDWEVSTFDVSETDASFFNIKEAIGACRFLKPGTYKRLTRGSTVIMSNTPAEIRDHMEFRAAVRLINGDALINGLGLGVALKMVMEYVDSVTVIEASEDVIKLCAPTYANDPKVNIIHADAFTWKPPKGMKYKCVWHDIWDDVCADNLPDMHKLHRRYGRRCEWQGSWCRALCEDLKVEEDEMQRHFNFTRSELKLEGSTNGFNI